MWLYLRDGQCKMLDGQYSETMDSLPGWESSVKSPRRLGAIEWCLDPITFAQNKIILLPSLLLCLDQTENSRNLIKELICNLWQDPKTAIYNALFNFA